MSACRRLVLLISIIGGFICIWLSIPNQFVIASYLAVAEHQIMFLLHSVSCKKPPTSECIQFFLLYTVTYVSYITEYEPCTWHHVAHLVFDLNLHTYIWKQATHSVGYRFINIYCTAPGGMCSLHLKFILL